MFSKLRMESSVQSSNSFQKFNWEVKAVRADIEPLQVEVTKEQK